MAAAALIKAPIPKLCATDSLEAFGSCRLCASSRSRAARARRPPARRPPRTAWRCAPRRRGWQSSAQGVMELYISDHPLDCLTCSANGDCELQTQAGVVGLARGALRLRRRQSSRQAPTDASNPYFTFESSKCIVCSRCVRACEEVQGTFALTILGRGFDSKVSTAGGRFLRLRMRLLRRLRAGLPDRDAEREKRHRDRQGRALGRHHLRLLRRRLFVQGGDARAKRSCAWSPMKAGKANEGHSCVKGRFAYGYATHKDRIVKPMIREKISDPWREVSWDEAVSYAASRVQAHPANLRPRRRSARSPPRAAPTRKCFSSRNWCAPDSATTTSTLAHASATRRPAMA